MICAVFPLGLLAQQRTEYNRKGDEAMKRLDYSDVKAGGTGGPTNRFRGGIP